MRRVKGTDTEAFTVAVVLHVTAAALAFVFSLLAQWWEEDPPVVLELVDLSASVPVAAESTVPAAALPEETVPEESLPPLERLALPELENLRPVPEVPPEPPPAPKPTPAPPKPAQPQITYDQHLREHGTPEVTPARPPRPRPVSAPTIETHAREALSQAITTPKLQQSTSFSQTQISALDAYVGGIQRRLQDVFRSVGATNLRATIEFTVAPDGTFQNYRVVRSSGDPAFDAAALATFRQLRRYQPTPDGRSYTWEIDFRNVE